MWTPCGRHYFLFSARSTRTSEDFAKRTDPSPPSFTRQQAARKQPAWSCETKHLHKYSTVLLFLHSCIWRSRSCTALHAHSSRPNTLSNDQPHSRRLRANVRACACRVNSFQSPRVGSANAPDPRSFFANLLATGSGAGSPPVSFMVSTFRFDYFLRPRGGRLMLERRLCHAGSGRVRGRTVGLYSGCSRCGGCSSCSSRFVSSSMIFGGDFFS